MDYIQIDRTNWMEIILQEFPAFQTQWDLHVESWNPLIDRPIALDVAAFADFAIEIVCLGVDLELDRLATITELILLKGDSTIEYIFRKMFLEQIAHRSVKGGFSVERFTRKLQPLASYHWQAIDREWHIHPSGVSSN
jgi:hypothetical protein